MKQTNMADVGDELLDGDLDETFDDLDGEQEDALLADDEFHSYENSQVIFRETAHSGDSHRGVYQVIEQVHDDEEILEDGVEDDVLDIAVVDELDESELEGQGTDQRWMEDSSRNNREGGKNSSDAVGVSSSTHLGLSHSLGEGGESDEENTESRGSRFRSERTNVISLKGTIGSKNLSDIPDSLDQVRTPMNNGGGMQRGRGLRRGLRGRLGPRGGMVGRGGPRHRHMMHPPQGPPPGHKIHLNPHFRGGHHGPNVWDNDRLPPPPGCESFPPPMGGPHIQDMGWRGPMPPHHMGRPPMPPHPHPHYGPRGPFPPPQGFPPHPPQGYEEPYHPMDQQQNPSSRVVQFNENSQLITVENQHFQQQNYDQNFGPPPNHNQFQPPPQFNNNMYPPNQYNPPQRPNFPPQNPYPPNPNVNPNYAGYPQQDYQQNAQFQNDYDWNSQQPGGDFYPPGPQAPPPSFNPQPQPQFQHPQPPFPNQPPNFRPPEKQFQQNIRGSVMKRLAPRIPVNNITPPKLKRLDQNKRGVPNRRSNLQEIETVDSLPDTTTKQDIEPEVEEDEETKQYRLKIAEQKALREKILREKEARRLAAVLEKQKQQNQTESSSNTSTLIPVQQSIPKPVQVQQKVNVQPVQRVQSIQHVRPLAGRGRGQSVNRVLQQNVKVKQSAKANQKPSTNVAKLPSTPQVQIQTIQGTTYKIVKVRTKEGSIVTRKTPIAVTQGGVTTSLTKTVQVNSNRKVLLNAINQTKAGTTSILRGTNVPRLVPTKNAQGRTLFTVETTPLANTSKTTSQRLVIDNRPSHLKVDKPDLPNSCLVTIDNLSLSTTQANIQKMAKQVGTLTSFTYEPEKKKATLKFQKVQQAKEFHNKFNRKMIDLSRILVTVVPE